MIRDRSTPRRRLRLLLPFAPQGRTYFSGLAALLLFIGSTVAGPRLPLERAPQAADAAPVLDSSAADGRTFLAASAPVGVWITFEGGARRDAASSRSARNRVPLRSAATAQESSRARATNAERLDSLPALARARTGVLAAGHTSLPPPFGSIV
jgi:hypothetical protein